MSSRWFLVAAALPLVAACAHANKRVAAEAPPPTAPGPAQVAAAPTPIEHVAPAPRTCNGDDACSANELCVSSRCVTITPEMAECHASTHFDFDRADLHPAELPRLQRMARCLKALPREKTLVEGSCDERGTVQYNIALGFRRAHATAKYLEDLGIPSANLSEISYGKELPLCTESTESCWAMNRRADVTPGVEPKDVTARTRADERRELHARATSGAQTSTPSARPAQARHALRGQTPAPDSSPSAH